MQVGEARLAPPSCTSGTRQVHPREPDRMTRIRTSPERILPGGPRIHERTCWLRVRKRSSRGNPRSCETSQPAFYFEGMRLPNGDRAVVDIQKLSDYCLNPVSPRGRHKARVFAAALGLRSADADFLRARLLEAARNGDAVEREVDRFGKRYTIDFAIKTDSGEATVRSGWIILHGKNVPRLTTCFVRTGKHE